MCIFTNKSPPSLEILYFFNTILVFFCLRLSILAFLKPYFFSQQEPSVSEVWSLHPFVSVSLRLQHGK